MTDEELRKAQLKDQYKQQAAGASLSEASPQGETGASLAYTPSSVVSQAQSYLAGLKNGQAQEFSSPYTQQIASLYDKIMNRPKFSYDANKDPLFQAYKNQYVRQGQRAMQDTVGQSAAMTGGYGNTWAATAGSQAYQDYLTRMTAMLPELEGRAYERYAGEGEQLQNQLSLASALEQQDYKRYRDALADWAAYQKSGGGSTPKKTTEDETDKLNIGEGLPDIRLTGLKPTDPVYQALKKQYGSATGEVTLPIPVANAGGTLNQGPLNQKGVTMTADEANKLIEKMHEIYLNTPYVAPKSKLKTSLATQDKKKQTPTVYDILNAK